MRASECSLQDLITIASGRPDLAILLSYIQVEYGVKDLEASWQGFIDTSDEYGEEFDDKHHICSEFEFLLKEFIEFHSTFIGMGS